jgi:hypothetical protein
MRRIAYLLLCAGLLALGALAGPARAGEVVWYKSGCCYENVVRAQPRAYVYRPERRQVVRFSEFDYYGNVRDPRCQYQEMPLGAGPGRWVWGAKLVCH